MFRHGPSAWIEYDGERWHRNRAGYYQNQLGRLLHRRVYADHVGALDPKLDVHHVDGDPANNDPSNLAALTRAEHMREHGPRGAIRPERRGSGAAAMWAKRKPVGRTCQLCGDRYESRSTYSRFCSKLCAGRARRDPDLRGGGIAAADR